MELCTVERGLGSSTLNILVDDEIQYIFQSKRKLFSKSVQFYDALTKSLLYQAKSRHLLGYVIIESQMYEINLKFLRPQFSRGIYGFVVEGMDFFWDFEYESHLRCFTTHDMGLVAQFFWKSSLLSSPFHSKAKPSAELDIRHSTSESESENMGLAQLVILRKVSESPAVRSIIIFTGLLLLKNSI
ncbi:hypothetical protein K7432_005854 [Basidiobolus ranarum]|uniref:Uncharacterized protein n=1 Tax=Basidiobolus ranarum TaxID=34480 RepID=A0ABR2W2I2_9FUNG